MARIRTTKPEFWASEQIMELSPLARLAFIGLWNFCDDGGVHPASSKTLKAEIFPNDDLSSDDVSGLVREMVAQGVLEEFCVEGKCYWFVTGWAKHQKINKPTFRHPRPPAPAVARAGGRKVLRNILGGVNEASSTGDGMLDDLSRMEGNGEEGNGISPSSIDEGSTRAEPGHVGTNHRLPDCPHEAIRALYAKHLPMLPQPRVWDGQRARSLTSRWRWVLTAKKRDGDPYASDAQTALAFFDRFFDYVASSSFLTGRDGKWSGCDLTWLVKAENFAKVIEGKYQTREAAE